MRPTKIKFRPPKNSRIIIDTDCANFHIDDEQDSLKGLVASIREFVAEGIDKEIQLSLSEKDSPCTWRYRMAIDSSLPSNGTDPFQACYWEIYIDGNAVLSLRTTRMGIAEMFVAPLTKLKRKFDSWPINKGKHWKHPFPTSDLHQLEHFVKHG